MSDAEIHREIEGVDVVFRFSSAQLTWSFEADDLVGSGWGSLHGAIQHVRTQLQAKAQREKALEPAVAAMSDDLVEAAAGLIEDVRRMLKLAQDPAWIHARGDMFDAWEAKDFPFIAAALKEE